MLKRWIALLTVMSITWMPVSFATESAVPVTTLTNTNVTTNALKTSYTLSEAIDKVTNDNLQLKSLVKQVDDFKKTHNNVIIAGNQAGENLKGYYDFKKMYETNTGYLQDNWAKYKVYLAQFGPAPTYSKVDLYNKFIVPRDITHYQVYVQLQSLKWQIETIKSQLASSMTSLYYSKASMEKTLKLQELSLNLRKDQYKANVAQYKAGKVSQNDLYKSESQLKQSEIQYQMSLRNYENLILNIKKAMHIKSTDQIAFTLTLDNQLTEKDYNWYLETSKKYSPNFKKASLSYSAQSRTETIADEYFNDKTDSGWVTIKNDKENAEYEFNKMQNELEDQIKTAYISLIELKNALDIKNTALKDAQTQMSQSEKLFKQGKMTKLQLNSVQLDLISKQLDVEKAKLNYEQQIKKMQNMCTDYSTNI